MSIHRVFRSVSRGLRAAGAGAAGGAVSQVGAVVAALQHLADQMQQFVAALSPATVQILNQEFKNLHATIGQSFLPAVQVMTQAVRDVADRISPAMQKAAPAMRAFADALAKGVVPLVSALASLGPLLADIAAKAASGLLPAFDGLVQIVRGFLPVLQAVVDIMPALVAATRVIVTTIMFVLAPVLVGLQMLGAAVQALNPVIQLYAAAQDGLALVTDTLTRIMSALAETVVQFIRSVLPMIGVGDAAKSVTQLFRDLAAAMVKVVAIIAKMVGATEFLKNLQRAFSPQEEEKGVRAQAAGPTSIKGLDQIVKDIATSSAMAQGKLGESEADKRAAEEAVWRAEVLADIQDIANNGDTFSEWLDKNLPRLFKAGWDLIRNEGQKQLQEGANRFADWADEVAAPITGRQPGQPGPVRRAVDPVNGEVQRAIPDQR